ncbi:GAF domain-containing protein [Hymenobacter sp. H14-R3]|uniref:GAF domain-containing protein n=1 Tax=Hymenobacter sp. H14-R3 TaxID=3046308 RepID=UPI0024BB611F|nr:GAF domain-containing protein [Hymenobacter sp. H14-R3]MDJ0365521.1 GAF domain-containing protein [Hymenobacter sp. H14-R3]
MSAALPISAAQEAMRLQALQPYKALQGIRNEVFEQIAQLVAMLFATPMAQVSLVDAEEVIYPGNVDSSGLATRLARKDCICAVAVYRPDTTTVFSDLRIQPCEWISLEAQQDIAFYASHPIQTTDGQPIGSLCVLDKKPRTFKADEQLVLQRMASLTMRLLDLELLALPTEAPALWAAINARIDLSLQRIETLTALARWEVSAETTTALAYQAAIQEERLLIVQDIEYEVEIAFSRLSRR